MGKKSDFKYEVAKAAAEIGIGKAAEMYAVSRKSAGIWLKLLKSGGREALANLSRTAQNCPAKMDMADENAILDLRRVNPELSAAEIKRKLNLDCSLAVICKKIRQAGLFNSRHNSSVNSWILSAGFKQLGDQWIFIAEEPQRKLIFTAISPENSALQAAIWLNDFLNIIIDRNNSRKSKIELTFNSDKITAGALKLVADRFLQVKIDLNITPLKLNCRELISFIKNNQQIDPDFNLAVELYTLQLVHNLAEPELTWQLLPLLSKEQRIAFLGQSITKKLKDDQRNVTGIQRLAIEKLLTASDLAYKSGDLAAAEKKCLLLIALHEFNRHDSAYLTALRRVALVYQKKGVWTSAQEYLLKAYQFSVKHADIVQQGRTAAMLANFFIQRSNLREAAHYAKIQLQSAEEYRSPADEINAQQVLGVIEEKRNRLSAAIVHYKRILALVEKTGDLSVKAQTLGNLGVVFYRQDKLRKAREYYEEAIFLTEKIADERQTARLYNNLGVIEEEEGRTRAAALCYKKMLDWAVKHQNPNWQLAALINFGSLQNDLGEYQSALSNLRTAYELAVKFKQEENRSLILANLGEVYRSLNLPVKALLFLNRAVRLAVRQENDFNLAGFYLELAQLEYSLNHLAKAEDQLQKSLESAQKAERKDLAESQHLLKLQLDYRQDPDLNRVADVLSALHNLSGCKSDPRSAALALVELVLILSRQPDTDFAGLSLTDWRQTALKKCSLLWKKSGVVLYKDQIRILNE